ncbi:hypothetical protein BC831DRAFT_471665, partial [Entophlyctis helioformis]
MMQIALVALLVGLAAAQSPLGRPCSETLDKFACDGKNFLSCDASTRTWQLQNICASTCTLDPTFGSFCFQNSLPGAPSTTTTPGENAGKTGNNGTSAGGNNNTNSGNSDNSGTGGGSGASLSTGAVIGISIGACVLVALIVAIVVFLACFRGDRRSDKNGDRFASSSGMAAANSAETLAAGRMDARGGINGSFMAAGKSSTSSAAPDVGTILERKFVVTTEYEPSASDELRLHVGDVIVLDLLFNDGWAKGKNETTRQEGILPVACIAQVE